MIHMPTLETSRLYVRPFALADLEEAHQFLDVELDVTSLHTERIESLAQRARWLQWSVLNYEQLALLNQPPYGDRAIVLKTNGQLIGACGFVPCLMPFEQLPGFGGVGQAARATPEFGLFYAISPSRQRRGYASEAAQALVQYAFEHLQVKRVVATTDADNLGSMGVMHKLGMHIEQNPLPEPPWLQVVGVVENTPPGREI